MKKPSSIHSKKVEKFSRRRLMRELAAAGFSAAAVGALTVDDVKAASSDQVPISLNIEGTRKVMVDADWYDRLTQARRVWTNIRDNWLERGKKDKENDVVGVWLDAGKGNENPHVIVSIDKDSNSKAETRGRIPERKEGVRVSTEETTREEELCDDILCPTTDGANWEDNPKEDLTEMPGGFPVYFKNPRSGDTSGIGTLTSRVVDEYNDYNYSLMTAAHVAEGALDSDSTAPCGSEIIGFEAYHNGSFLGYVESVSHVYDFVLIYDSNSWDRPHPEVWDVEDHSRRFYVDGSLSADGVDYCVSNSITSYKYGCGHGESYGNISARGQKEAALSGESCTDYWYETVRWGEFCHMGPGDSGSLSIVRDPQTGDYWACNMNSWRWWDYSAGTAAYAIANFWRYVFRSSA